MAHEVQAGTTRVKLRSPGVVLLLNIVTSAIASVFYWFALLRDVSRYETEEHGSTGVRLEIETAVAGLGFLAVSIMNFMPDGSEQASTIDPTTGLPVATTQAADGSTVFGLVFFALYALWLYMAFRMRSHINRVMSHAGMLPEDRPSAVVYYICCIFGPGLGSVAAVSNLNKAWEEFPRYYASIGGTKDDVARVASTTAASPVASSPDAYAGAPAPAMQVTPIAVGVPVPAAAPTPHERMQQLAAGASAGSLTSAESLEYAEAVEQVHGSEHAAPWYQYVAVHDPSCHKAMWWCGIYLLDRNDPAGIEMLHRVMANPAYASWARERVAVFLEAHGRHDEAARYRPAA